MNQAMLTTVQTYRVYIKASPEKVWAAITQPEWTERYGYGGRGVYDLRVGGRYQGFASEEMKSASAARGAAIPEAPIQGEIIECDPPHRLVLTWHMNMDEGTRADAVTRLSYELESLGGVTKLTLIHDLTGAPMAADILSGTWEAQGAGGGWAWVLSELKSVLETNSGFPRGR